MAVASYMDFFGYRFAEGSTPNEGTVEIDYRIKYNAPVATANVRYILNGDETCHFEVTDLGRKHRNSKAEQERVYEILRVARNYRRLLITDPENNRTKSFSRASR